MQPTSAISRTRPTAITVGTFDGVHRGHREVVDFLKQASEERHLRPGVITFDPHPLAVIAPERAPGLLELPAQRKATLEEMGVDVTVLPFNEELRRLTVAQWFSRLATEFGVRLLVAGYDNTFGSDGMHMDIADYQRIGADAGIEVLEAPEIAGVSSSKIRRALRQGDMTEATAMLGRPFTLSGVVGHGREFGRKIGFPTANVITDSRLLLPAPGVYAVDAALPDGGRRRAVVNIGHAPTAGTDLPLTVEAHIIDYTGDLCSSITKRSSACSLPHLRGLREGIERRPFLLP